MIGTVVTQYLDQSREKVVPSSKTALQDKIDPCPPFQIRRFHYAQQIIDQNIQA